MRSLSMRTAVTWPFHPRRRKEALGVQDEVVVYHLYALGLLGLDDLGELDVEEAEEAFDGQVPGLDLGGVETDVPFRRGREVPFQGGVDGDLLVEGRGLDQVAVLDLDLDVLDGRVGTVEGVAVERGGHAGGGDGDLGLVDLQVEGAWIVEPGGLPLLSRLELAAEQVDFEDDVGSDPEVDPLQLGSDRALALRLLLFGGGRAPGGSGWVSRRGADRRRPKRGPAEGNHRGRILSACEPPREDLNSRCVPTFKWMQGEGHGANFANRSPTKT